MKKSTFKVNKMDCPNEEQIIRIKLDALKNVKKIDADLPRRILSVHHGKGPEPIISALEDLQLDSKLIRTEKAALRETDGEANQRSVLIWVLVINFVFFFIEAITGFFYDSMALVADSLDMLADSIVYGLSLYVVGRSITTKKQVTKLMGVFQFGLAVFGLSEVIRRFFGFEGTPVFQVMILVSTLALAANLVSLILLQRSKSEEVHIQASWIFTTNDVLANIGVILAGIMVYFTRSLYPDLIIGSLIFIMVARGSYKIMKLSKS